jgi:hypothetical protein
MMKMRTLLAASLMMGAAPAAIAQPGGAEGWISHAEAGPAVRPIVLHFRRTVTLPGKPRAYKVRVTADNRFILFVNGARVATGPSTGDILHWREESIDLAPYMKRGVNVVAATVWNGVQPLKLPANPTPAQVSAAQGNSLFTNTAPLFQQSVATGFRLIGEGDAAELSTDRAGWRVKRDQGRGFANGWGQVKRWYYVAGNPEKIDAAKADFDAAGPQEKGEGWQDAVPAPDAAKRTLVPDRLPQQSYTQQQGDIAYPARRDGLGLSATRCVGRKGCFDQAAVGRGAVRCEEPQGRPEPDRGPQADRDMGQLHSRWGKAQLRAAVVADLALCGDHGRNQGSAAVIRGIARLRNRLSVSTGRQVRER